MTKYTYYWVEPSDKPPFKKTTRFTRGTFAGWTEPQGLCKVPYAMFKNRASTLYIPLYDLTPETKEALKTIECTICRREVPHEEYYASHIDSHPCE